MTEIELIAETLVEGDRCLRKMRALRDELVKRKKEAMAYKDPSPRRSAARRASMDLTRALSAFRNHERLERDREYREFCAKQGMKP